MRFALPASTARRSIRRAANSGLAAQPRAVAAAAALCLATVATVASVAAWPARANEPPAAKDVKEAKDAKSIKKWDVNQAPGKPATVNIDTRTGTWMSVDVSPDGQRILFDLLGEVYELPIAGGEAKPLTRSMAWDMQARYSPDGKRITFMTDAGGADNIWVMNADGSGAKAVSTEDYRTLNNPVWHPSGQYIAARKHYSGTRSLGSGEIWLFHADGGKGIQLNEKPNWQKDLGEPAFSPDGRYVYFSQDVTPGRSFEYNKDSNGSLFAIKRIDTRDGSSETLVSGPGGAVRPTPSPDGKFLAFVRRVRNQSTLFLKDLNTGREFPVWGGLERDMQEAWSVQGVYPSMAWTPDGKSIVTWGEGGKLWRVDVASRKASEIPFRVRDTREVRQAQRVSVDVAPAQFDVNQLRSVNVSPQGDRVVYSALGNLWVKELPKGTPRRLTTQANHFEYFPRFSRDGKEVVYVSWNDKDQGRVRKLDLRSGRDAVLTPQPGKYLEPSFSPDGKTVVYVKDRGGYLLSPWNGMDTGIYRVASDGKGVPERITKEGEAPQFGERNDQVFVTRRGVEKEVELFSKLVRIDLDDQKQEVEVANSEAATEYAVSPDGRWLGFVERFHTFVTPMPATGKSLRVGPKMDAVPVRQLDAIAGQGLHWGGTSPSSQALHFALGDELFTSELKNTFGFVSGAPAELPKVPAVAQKIGFTQKADVPQGMTALTGARIVTMKGDEVIENGVVLVEGNRIVAVGASDKVTVPAQATKVDARGKTIIPGLVDVHWHGGMGEDGIIPQQSWINYASLAFGVTTLHDPSNDTATIFNHAEMQRAGQVVGPRIFSTGTILYGAKGDFAAQVSGFDDALKHLQRMKAAGAISVKSYNQPRREQRQQILEAARQTGLMVVPEGGSLFQANMSMVVDGHTGVEHAIPVARSYDDVKQLWSQTAVGYTPTLAVAYGGLDGEHYWYARTDVWKHPLLTRYVPRTVLESRSVRRPTAPDEDYNVFKVASNAADLARAGVIVNIGAHGQREGLAAHWEIWTLALGGMTRLEALRSATLSGARYLGMDKDIGSIEPGKLADLVVIDGNPLADIRQSDRVQSVMLNGRLYDAATMNEVGRRPKARQPFFFEGEGNASTPVISRGHSHTDDASEGAGHGH